MRDGKSEPLSRIVPVSYTHLDVYKRQPQDKDLRGYLFVSSGLGGMSGAQPKAAVIAGAASIIAEVDACLLYTSIELKWVILSML